MKPRISMIAAIGEGNRALGKDNKLLWNIPEDLQHFRETTKGHVIIMGRKTYESIGRVLPNRINIVITRDQSFKVDEAVIVNSLDEALEKASSFAEASADKKESEVFIIGGGQIYEQALPFADRLYLTVVEGNYEADTFFPAYSEFKKVVSQKKGESGKYRYTFIILEKAGPVFR